MTTLEIVATGLVFAVALIFTLISLSHEKEVHFKLFAGIVWFVFAFVYFVMGDKTVDASMTYAISFLWLGLGFIFTVWGISTFFDIKKEKIWKFD